MKKLLASASLLILSSAAASAADLPMKAPPMVAPIPVFSWTGCYIGAHAGGGTSHDSWTNDFSFEGSGGHGGTGTGAVAGGQIGCNYQDGNTVFGIEGEGYWSNIRTSSGFASTFEGFVTDSLNVTTKNKSDYDIAARVGIAFDRTLIYGKAGWAWGNFDFGAAAICCGIGAPVDLTAGSKTLDGLLLGIGIEHALTRNWTVKLEYNFIDFGSKSAAFTTLGPGCLGGVCSQFTQTVHVEKQIFKVGFNYLFPVGGYAPVVARY